MSAQAARMKKTFVAQTARKFRRFFFAVKFCHVNAQRIFLTEAFVAYFAHKFGLFDGQMDHEVTLQHFLLRESFVARRANKRLKR
jgi:hypothetical protein